MTRVETAVILVSDLVGSTALASRLGSARFDLFRREHDSILRDAVEDAGGRVVKNTGDGVLAAFPSVAGALDGAVSIQQRLDRRNRHVDAKMDVRVGISVGDATVEDGDYFGVPPTEATRLCARALGGQILIADPVRAVQRGQGTHPLEPVGPLELKGLPEPVVAWRVLWTPFAASAGPVLPPRLRGIPDTAYVGRAAERGALVESWDRAVEGGRQVVVISGEPGIGKTRLVTQTARTALPDDAVILYGRCDEDQGMPYYPWLEVLRDYVQIAPRRLLRPRASELSRLVPGLGARLGTVAPPRASDPETERYLLFEAVQSLLAAAAEVSPVLVILDDLHWADRATLLLLKHLVTSTATGRLMLLGTFRDSDLEPEGPLARLLADLYREPGVTRLSLVGLGEAEIVDLVQEIAGHEIDPTGRALAGEIHRETAGNPFFVEEVVRHLVETGAIGPAPDGGWSFGLRPGSGETLPQSVRGVIERRLGRLGPAARDVLRVGAVVGGDFEFELIARAVGLPPAEVLDLLDAGIAASLLKRTEITRASAIGAGLTEVYSFSHGLVQATLYDGLPAGRRASLHLAVGAAIEALAGDEVDARLPELAHHFLAATPAGERSRAVDYAGRAGDQAMAQFAYDQAAELFAGALDALGPDRPRARIALLQALGDAQMRAGDSEAARRTLFEAADAARRHDEPEALARATRACGIWGLSLGMDDELVGLAEESIARLEGWGCPRLIAEIKGLLAAALYYAPVSVADRRASLAAEALAAARAEHAQAGDRQSMETLAYVLGRCLLARWGPESSVADFGLAEELLDLCRELGDAELELLARNWRGTAFLELGDFAALEREIERIGEMAAELRQPRAMAFVPLHRGMLAVTGGRFAEAERLNAESLEIGRRVAGSVSQLAAYSQLQLIRLHQGRLPELEDLVRGMLASYPEIVALRCGLIALLLQADRPEEARVEFERVLGGGLGALP
ncbi:MAG: hypothetical protein QOE44_1485, partial [Solirubrobacteraceae bacterium]|nr:hypothetical protein [Solirubrobacteraceae bacterium]